MTAGLDLIAPVVQIDTREQLPLDITAYPVEVVGLPVGDYGVKGFSDWSNPAFSVERKSLADLCGSLGQGRERFFREIEKLRQFRFAALLVEAHRAEVESGAYRSQISAASVLASIDCIAVRAGVHVFWCGSAGGAARQLEGLVKAFCGGIAKDWKRITGDKT